MAGQQYKATAAACFKCMIWYKNGYRGVYFSRDLKYGKFRPDLGLLALEELVARRAGKLHHAMIWDKREGRDLLIRECKNYNDGWLVKAPVKF